MSINNLEPQLQQIMDHIIAGRRQRFAKNEPAEGELRNDLLEFLVGEGLAEVQIRGGKPIWVATDRLAKTLRGEQIDLSTIVHGNAGETVDQPKLPGSLKIMLTAFIDHARKEQSARGEEPDKVTIDEMLRILAGSGKARLMPGPDGKLVWVPSPGAFEEFNEMVFGHRTIEIRTDDVLKHMAQNFYELSKALMVGDDVSKDVAALAMLQNLEVAGDAIAYRDLDGALAWRASKQLRRSGRRRKPPAG
jgi:hypothetical protein